MGTFPMHHLDGYRWAFFTNNRYACETNTILKRSFTMNIFAIILIVLGVIVAVLKGPKAFNPEKAKEDLLISELVGAKQKQIQQMIFLIQKRCKIWVVIGISFILIGAVILIF